MKKINFRTSIVVITIMFLVASCASIPKINAVRVDPPSIPSDAQPKPTGIIEDSSEITEFGLFPDTVDKTIVQIINSKKVQGIKSREIQSAVCNGKVPKFNPSYKVHLIPPKTPPGVGLDIAAQERNGFISSARSFLKTSFFRDAADTSELNVNGNCYLSALKNKGNETFGLRGCRVEIPFVTSSNKNEVENILGALSGVAQRDARNGAGLMSIVFPESKTAILTQGSIPMYHAEWDRYYGTTLSTRIATQSVVSGKGHNGSYGQGREHSDFYVPSNYGWKIQDKGIVYPLRLSAMTDLSVLIHWFSFTLPKELICKIAFQNKVGPTGNYVDCDKVGKETGGMFQNWGYDFESGQYSATAAAKDRDFMWERILTNQTSVKEAAQEDGSVDFEVSLDLSLFCQYGTPLTDLVSQ